MISAEVALFKVIVEIKNRILNCSGMHSEHLFDILRIQYMNINFNWNSTAAPYFVGKRY